MGGMGPPSKHLETMPVAGTGVLEVEEEMEAV